MPWIQNISRAAVQSRVLSPKDLGNTILIQIADPGQSFPTPQDTYTYTYRFEFADVNYATDVGGEHIITDTQAGWLVDILSAALDSSYNVVVHCSAGICRSGAVCEVGVIMGFSDLARTRRQPNLAVKYKMMKKLGLTYE